MAAVTKWTTKDGREIPIREMTDSHLLNTIRFLRRQGSRAQWAEVSSLETAAMMTNGEMAEYYLDRDASVLADMDPDEYLEMRVPQFARLLREAKRRKLTPTADPQPQRDRGEP